MNFKAYDIISKLLPGYALAYSLIFLYADHTVYFKSDFFLPITVIAYFLGYILDTFSSWLEDIFYFTWKGKPSTRLLSKYKGIWKIPPPHFLKKLKKDTIKTLDKEVSDDELFRFIQSSAYAINKDRLSDFLQNFIFARVLLTLIIVLTVLFGIKYYCYWQFFLISLPILFVCWYRAKQRAYYYAAEVLRIYHSSKIKNK